jgi:hypothetical protein
MMSEPAVKAAVQQENVGDLLIEPDDVRKQRRLNRPRIGHKPDHALRHQRRVRAEEGAGGELFLRGRRDKIQREVDGWPPAVDVVLQVSVEALVPQVRLGCEADKHHVEFLIGQAVCVAQPIPASVFTSHLIPVRAVHARPEQRDARRAVQRRGGLGCADVEPAEGIGRCFRAEPLARLREGAGEDRIEALER